MTLTHPVADEFTEIAKRMADIREEAAKLVKERDERIAKEEAQAKAEAAAKTQTC